MQDNAATRDVPRQVSAVPGEEKIPQPSGARQRLEQEAAICAIRACRLAELGDFQYGSNGPPVIYYFVDNNEIGIGRCIYPKYRAYMAGASPRGRPFIGDLESKYKSVAADVAALCPNFSTAV